MRSSGAATIAYGGKSANLGEVMNARLPASCAERIYHPFFTMTIHQENKLKTHLRDDERSGSCMIGLQAGAALAMRERIQKVVNAKLRSSFNARHATSRAKNVRPHRPTRRFAELSGAGLYNTVPNVKGKRIIEAIKTVWLRSGTSRLTRQDAPTLTTQNLHGRALQEALIRKAPA